MNKREKDYLIALGAQEKQFDALYRKAALSYGLSDCSMWVLYFLSLHGDLFQLFGRAVLRAPRYAKEHFARSFAYMKSVLKVHFSGRFSMGYDSGFQVSVRQGFF